jgi:copper chaperone CopZ
MMDKTAKLLRFRIEGMTCSHCVKTIRKALQKQQGVESVDINLDSGMAVVKVGDAQTDKLIDAVEKAGYSVKLTDF